MPRILILALVFAALAFVLLRPLCELAFAGDGHSEVASLDAAAGSDTAAHADRGNAPSGICCDSAKDGTLVKSVELLASWTQGGSLGIAFFASAGLLLFARPRDPARWRLAIPPERSFYARSARILR